MIKLKKIIDKNDAEIMIDIDIDIYKNQELGDDIQFIINHVNNFHQRQQRKRYST